MLGEQTVLDLHEPLRRRERARDRLEVRQDQAENTPDPLDALELLANLLAQIVVLAAPVAKPVFTGPVRRLDDPPERLEITLECRPCLGEHLLELAVPDRAGGALDVFDRLAQRAAE